MSQSKGGVEAGPSHVRLRRPGEWRAACRAAKGGGPFRHAARAATLASASPLSGGAPAAGRARSGDTPLSSGSLSASGLARARRGGVAGSSVRPARSARSATRPARAARAARSAASSASSSAVRPSAGGRCVAGVTGAGRGCGRAGARAPPAACVTACAGWRGAAVRGGGGAHDEAVEELGGAGSAAGSGGGRATGGTCGGNGACGGGSVCGGGGCGCCGTQWASSVAAP